VGYEASWEDTLQLLLDGEVDVATGAYKTDARKALYDFSLPMGTSAVCLSPAFWKRASWQRITPPTTA
jgi:hypothetical protein